jgi:hypothetical protein
MDGFIRRQYTYRGVDRNPLLKVDFVWRSLSPAIRDGADSDDGSLSDVEQVKDEKQLVWADLSISDRINVMHDLCEWHLLSERFRTSLGVTELDSTSWRIEPIGRDSNDVLYYYLDDGRLYCQTDPTIQCAQTALRRRKRQRILAEDLSSFEEDWTCIATNYSEWLAFSESLSDPINSNERRLYQTIQNQLLPGILASEEERKSKLEREAQLAAKELLLAEALSTRKRSSRIQVIEERRHEQESRLAEQRRRDKMELAAKRLLNQEKGLDSRISQPRMTREARARDRELRLFMRDRSGSKSPAVFGSDSHLASHGVPSPAETDFASTPALASPPDAQGLFKAPAEEENDLRQKFSKPVDASHAYSETIEHDPAVEHGLQDNSTQIENVPPVSGSVVQAGRV